MIPKLFVIIFLQFLSSFKHLLAEDITLTLPEGQIVGVTDQSTVTNSTRQYYSFYGLRYAQPPIGDLRFKPPQPVKNHENIYDAKTQKGICYQVNTDNVEENEDCLYLNVFTPMNPLNIDNNTELLPVMVIIHGGGFMSGSGLTSGTSVGIWSPDFFMDYGVVMVVINYRLGPFGFLSTGDEVIPGNMGLKDQNMALQWVKSHIRLFGGDENNIIIDGQSAGAASVGFHVLSPKSAGLFQGAICESASALTPWSYQRNHVEIAFATAGYIDQKFNDVNSRNSTELLNFLLNVSASDLDKASYQYYTTQETLDNSQMTNGFFYAPVIEVEHEDAFVTELMYVSLENGNFNKVPLLIGTNAEEAMDFYGTGEGFSATVQALQSQPQYLASHDLHIDGENKTAAGKLVRAQYMGEGEINNESIAQTIKYFSDQCFTRSIIKHAQLQSKYSDVFFYVFSHHGYMGGNHVTFPGTGNVTHSEELPYLYAKYILSDTPNYWVPTSNLTQFSKEDLDVHYRLMTFWTNFAKYHNPTPKKDEVLQNVIWPKVNVSNGADFQYLDVGHDLNVKTNPRGEAFQFWEKLYEDFAIPPLDSY